MFTRRRESKPRFELAASKHRLGALDGWRAVAIFLVIAGHLVNYSAMHNDKQGKIEVADIASRLGVFIFFVISGYVISSGLQREDQECGRISLRAFYIRRCFRILPPLWCYLVTVALLSHAGLIQTPGADVMKAAAFACNFENSHCSWHLAHTWSLGFEEQFYILFPLSLLVFSPRSRGVFLGAFFVFSSLILTLYWLKWGAAAGYLRNFQYILTGVVMALFSEELKIRLPKLNSAIICLLAAATLVLYCLPPSAPLTILQVCAGGPLIGLILFSTVYFPGWIKTVLSIPLVQFAGRVSYGIYLWQQLATGYYPGAGPLFYLCSLSSAVMIAVLSFLYIEKPLIEFAARISKRVTRRQPDRLVEAPDQCFAAGHRSV